PDRAYRQQRDENLRGGEWQRHRRGSGQGDRQGNRRAAQDQIPGTGLDQLAHGERRRNQRSADFSPLHFNNRGHVANVAAQNRRTARRNKFRAPEKSSKDATTSQLVVREVMPIPLNKTKIVATIGPASSSPQVLEQMIHAGMNVARLNFSHGEF